MAYVGTGLAVAVSVGMDIGVSDGGGGVKVALGAGVCVAVIAGAVCVALIGLAGLDSVNKTGTGGETVAGPHALNKNPTLQHMINKILCFIRPQILLMRVVSKQNPACTGFCKKSI